MKSTPVILTSVTLLVTIILFAVGELVVASRDTDRRIGELEREQDRLGESIEGTKETVKKLTEMVLEKRDSE